MEESFRWYEERRGGLGLEFLGEIKAVLDKITEDPLRHPDAYRGTRRSLVRRFPFAIVYIFERGNVEVIAVAHVKRDPVFWKRRVR